MLLFYKNSNRLKSLSYYADKAVYCFPSFTSSFFFSTQHQTHKRTYRMQKDNNTCVFILSSFANQAVSQSYSMLKTFSLSFVLRIYSFFFFFFFSSFCVCASHRFAFATVISNHA